MTMKNLLKFCLACDPAGLGFNLNPLYQARGSPKLAARNVQTIHTVRLNVIPIKTG